MKSISTRSANTANTAKKKKKKKKKKGAFSADSQPNISGARADRLRVLPNTIIFFDIMLLNLAICKF